MGIDVLNQPSAEDIATSSEETSEITNSDIQELKINITYGDQKTEVSANQPWYVSIIDGKLSVEVPFSPASVN